MKNNLSKSLVIALAATSSLLVTSCATLFSGKTTPLVLVNCPNDLKVSEDGNKLNITQVQSHGRSGSEVTVTYFAAGVELNKKQKHHKITFESNGIKKDLDVKMKVNGAFVVLDLFTSGIIGIAVDAGTKKWRKVKNRHVDVNAVINGTEPMSQHKLKKLVRKQARG